MSGISWTQATWNPVTGCDRISPGCDHCYALRLAGRLKAMDSPKYQRDGDPRTSGPGFKVTVHPAAVHLPLRWRKPRLVFVNSMSDLFHQDVPTNWLADIFAVMAVSQGHTFQILTKRHGRARSVLNTDGFVANVYARAEGKGEPPPGRPWPLPNVWMGVSTEDQKWADIRVPALLDTPAAVRWISAEPLLGPLVLHRWLPNGQGEGARWNPRPSFITDPAPVLDWVVVGGESGPAARPCDPAWVRQIRDTCDAGGVAFYFKQWSGPTPGHGGCLLDGRLRQAYPTRPAARRKGGQP